MASRKSRRRSLTDDERALWDHVTREVRRTLESMPDPDGAADEAVETGPAGAPVAKAKRVRRTLVPPPEPTPSPGAPTLTPALAPGAVHEMDRRTAQRFKRGKMPIDARLDLHGHSQQQAHRALNRFIEDAFHYGMRTVLVVTGKGSRDGEPGVLWRAVPSWLNDAPLRQWISGFSHATQRDGGTGALYVRVKRRRDD